MPVDDPANAAADANGKEGTVRPTDWLVPVTAPADTAPDEFTLPPAPVSDTEDRVLLQFAATVPHDLAELRRIAADNQW